MCKACALDMSDYVRVDIISLEDIVTRRLTTHESLSLLEITTFKLAVIVGFKVSYTLEDFHSDNPDVITQTLKDNYALSVAKEMFTPLLATEIQLRTTDSAELIAKILPAEVVFGKSYVILYTTYRPTGTLFSIIIILLVCVVEFRKDVSIKSLDQYPHIN